MINIKIIQLQIYKYLVLGDAVSSIILARSIHILATELNTMAQNIGIQHEIYRVAIDKAHRSPTYGKPVLLALLPTGNYARVPVS